MFQYMILTGRDQLPVFVPAVPSPPEERQVVQSGKQQDFSPIAHIAQKFGTDKVAGAINLDRCMGDPNVCQQNSANRMCRPWGHFYHTMYNRWLGPMSTQETEPFQFLEIGYYNGKGFDSYMEFLPNAESHSIEIAFIEPGPREENKWPGGNFAAANPRYEELLKKDRLHCGDASNYEFLNKTWSTKLNRPDAPPLKVVVDDGAHLADHMAMSLFFWFPCLQPGGLMIVEDIEPSAVANRFRTDILP